MVHAAVAGVAGRMGSRIAQLIRETDGIELCGGFEYPNTRISEKTSAKPSEEARAASS